MKTDQATLYLIQPADQYVGKKVNYVYYLKNLEVHVVSLRFCDYQSD